MSKLDKKGWFVYLLRCENGALYCGITTDLSRRLRQHNGQLSGGAKYTRAHAPCTLIYQENAANRSAASKREHEIKAMSRALKLALISTAEIKNN